MKMKVYKLNKNVTHNGKSYIKGETIKENDDNFSALMEPGHVDTIAEIDAPTPQAGLPPSADAGVTDDDTEAGDEGKPRAKPTRNR